MHPIQRKILWLFGVVLTLLLAACGGQTSGGSGGGGGGSSNTVTVRQTDSGPLVGAYYRVGGGSWQTLSFSNGQATFTATGDYEVAVRCQKGNYMYAVVHLFKATVSQTNALSFPCAPSSSKAFTSRTFQVTAPTSIGVQPGDVLVAGFIGNQYSGSNPVTVNETYFPDGPQEVLLTAFRVTGGSPPTSVTPIGYKLVNLNLVGGGPFNVDATGWQPFVGTRAISGLNLPIGFSTSGATVSFFRNGMKTDSIVGAFNQYGLLDQSGKYLGFVRASSDLYRYQKNESLLAIKETEGKDWIPNLMKPWPAGGFKVEGDTLTFNHPQAQAYLLGAVGLLEDNGTPLEAVIWIYPSGSGPTTYTLPVVQGLNYTLTNPTTRSGGFNLVAGRGGAGVFRFLENGVPINNLFEGHTPIESFFRSSTPTESELSGLDFALVYRPYESFSGASYTLP